VAKPVEERFDLRGVGPEPVVAHKTYNTRHSMAMGVSLCP
jgi:hypothetical protein